MNLPSKINLNEELVFQNIEQQSFKSLDAQKLTIKSSVIRNCDFSDVNLGYCDLLSSKLFNISFKNVSFVCADIYSLWFSECKFDNVDFSEAGIEDITFNNCQFNNCIFENVGLKNCVFSNSHFIGINPISASFTLNQYSECTFEKCKFKGSFLYQIFNQCNFYNVEMEYSLLKYNFGIGNKEIKYVKNNISMENPTQLYELLLDECIKQNLFLNATFVNFNMTPSINPQLILKSIDAIEIILSKKILIRNDEILFLKNLYQFLYEEQMIAPILLYQLLNKIKGFSTFEQTNIAYAKSRQSLSLIYNDLYFNFFTFCDKLQQTLECLPQYETPLKLLIDYESEPDIPLAELLNQCLPNSFKRIKGVHGSFHEIMEMSPQGLNILNIFLQILGISIPIIYTELKEKKNNLSREKTVEKTVNFNIKAQDASKNSTKLVQQTCKTIVASGILNEDLKGYNNSNIKKINIQYNINIQV